MPQTPIGFNGTKPNGALAPNSLDAQRTLMSSAGGLNTALGLTTATVVKNGTPGRVCRVSVIVAGSAVGTINDLATTSGAAAANQVFTIPNTVGIYDVQMPCAVGILVVPGTGQTVAVSYN